MPASWCCRRRAGSERERRRRGGMSLRGRAGTDIVVSRAGNTQCIRLLQCSKHPRPLLPCRRRLSFKQLLPCQSISMPCQRTDRMPLVPLSTLLPAHRTGRSTIETAGRCQNASSVKQASTCAGQMMYKYSPYGQSGEEASGRCAERREADQLVAVGKLANAHAC